MYIQTIKLNNFRNYANSSINFAPGYNVLTGDNGVGKTNILESISILSNIRSFRNLTDEDIVKKGENWYYCAADVVNNNAKLFEVGYSKIINKTYKKFKIDGVEIKKPSEYYGKLLCVVISPDDIGLINGNPEERRKYFDGVFSKIDSEYFDKLAFYKKILQNRNSIIKNIKDSNDKEYFKIQLEAWDTLFSETASFIIKKRSDYSIELNKDFGRIYQEISGCEIIPQLNYISNIPLDNIDEIHSHLKKNYHRDIAIGTTSIGPQRDDYLIEEENGGKFKSFCSQGQKRSAAISLKAAELSFIEKRVKKKQ